MAPCSRSGRRTAPTAEGCTDLLKEAAVPVWLPWPIPLGWLVTGFTGAGDDRSGTTGLRGRAVRAQPGRRPGRDAGHLRGAGGGPGRAVRRAAGPDPGEGFATGPPHALVQFGHHEFPLWHVGRAGAAAFAGEVLGSWLWIMLWPDTAGMLLLETLSLRDLRDPGQELDVSVRRADRRGCRG